MRNIHFYMAPFLIMHSVFVSVHPIHTTFTQGKFDGGTSCDLCGLDDEKGAIMVYIDKAMVTHSPHD